MSEWRCRNSAHGDREHYIPITTAEQKKHLFHLTKGIPRSGDPTHCGLAIDAAHAGASRARNQHDRARFLAEMKEIPIPCGFSNIRRDRANASESDWRAHAQRRERAIRRRAKRSIGCEKKFRASTRTRALGDRIRCESRESLQVIRARCRSARRFGMPKAGAWVPILQRRMTNDGRARRAGHECGAISALTGRACFGADR
jgi:hypothetical protein